MSNCKQCIIHRFVSYDKFSNGDLRHLETYRNEVVHKKGDVIFGEGSLLKGLYCVRKGSCKLSKLSSNGKDQIVRFVNQGELLGYRSLMSEEPANLTVTAVNEMHTCFISKEKIFEVINNNPDFAKDFFKVVCDDLRDANTALSDMANKTVRERLAKSLLYLEGTFGNDNDGFISVSLSREEIANIIGTATESAIRLLSEFKKDDLISLSGKKIKLEDRKLLEKIASSF